MLKSRRLLRENAFAESLLDTAKDTVINAVELEKERMPDGGNENSEIQIVWLSHFNRILAFISLGYIGT